MTMFYVRQILINKIISACQLKILRLRKCIIVDKLLQ